MNENEENYEIEKQELNEVSETEDVWTAPPLPEEIVAEEIEPPQMSEVSTLINIFIEPGKTFDDLRRKPRFIIAGIIIALLVSVFTISFQQKVGEDRIRRLLKLYLPDIKLFILT